MSLSFFFDFVVLLLVLLAAGFWCCAGEVVVAVGCPPTKGGTVSESWLFGVTNEGGTFCRLLDELRSVVVDAEVIISR